MIPYIAILRGINVGGKNPVPMGPLKVLFGTLGLGNVTTYIQSGNVVFRAAEADPGKLEQMISDSIRSKFGIDVPVIVLSGEELRKILDRNPFLSLPGYDEGFLHITILANEPSSAGLPDPKGYLPDEYRFLGRAVYLYCPNGYGQTKLTNTFFESRLKVRATTRNLRTMRRLAEISNEVMK